MTHRLVAKLGEHVPRLEAASFCAVALWAACLQFVAASNVGGLWRDEVNTVNLARMPSVGEMLAHNHYDSFPVLYSLILRAWIGAGLGESDAGLRALGAVLGCGSIAVAWWLVRMLGGRVPLLAAALLGLSPVIFRFSNGVRAYSLGLLTMLLAIGAAWCFVRSPRWRTGVLAAIAGLLAVHSVYVNAFMLAATLLAAAVVCGHGRQWRTVLGLAAIGLASAASLLPYVVAFRSHSAWTYLVHVDFDLSWLAARLFEALGSGYTFRWVPLGWVLMVAAVVAACGSALGGGRDLDVGRRALFVLSLLGLGAACFVGYLRFLSVHTTVWYYLPVLGLCAVVADAAVGLVERGLLARSVRIAAVIAVVAVLSKDAWTAAHTKVTNYDQIARRLSKSAVAGDFVVVDPWYAGVTFHRYYRGEAQWTTLPKVDYEFQHYRPLLERMRSPQPIDEIVAAIERTLRTGGTVFVVGEIARLQPGEQPGTIPPMTDGNATHFKDMDYLRIWLRQMTAYLQDHALDATTVPLPSNAPLTRYEVGKLYSFHGWREAGANRSTTIDGVVGMEGR